MQLSARILTALAVLAFAVGVVAGAQNATNEVSAATGTIDALNVGACTTNNADVFSKSNCTQTKAFFQQGELEDLIEVDSVYATYAHDPKTAAENPRAILEDSDLVRISVSDKDRDRRDPVLITADNTDFDTGDGNPFAGTPQGLSKAVFDPAGATGNTAIDAQKVVAESAFGDEKKTADLPALEQGIQFGTDDADDPDTNVDEGDDEIFLSSGTYQVLFAGATADDPFKPIADPKSQGGTVKFFGRVDDGQDTGGDGVDGDGPFRDIGKWVKIDEDVISGDTDVAPAMKLNISVPTGGSVQLQLIYYETSGVEYIQGGIQCVDDPDASATRSNPAVFDQAECTADERKGDDNQSFVLYAESDEDAGGNGTEATHRKNLALIETGRFSGVFQGYIRLTDADGEGGSPRDNWGRMKKSGNIVNGTPSPLADGITAAELLAGKAVLGVGNGPVTVIYKDSDGNNKSLNIEIDVEPPTIQIEDPTHNKRSDDEKPSFIGKFNDNDAGLAADSFQLNVDNRNQAEPESVMKIDSGVKGTGTDGSGQVLRRLDYTGYATNDTFGIIGETTWMSELYKAAETPPTGQAASWKQVEADDFDDGEADGEFNEEVEIDFDEASGVQPNFEFNHAIDFQAVVRDLAGNIGFSDSDAAKPRFIDAWGEKDHDPAKRGPTGSEGKKHNILGFFSAHVVHIDDKDPEIVQGASVTGFYGLDSDDNPIRDRSAVMVTFDGGVNGDLIDTGTFTLEYDDESAIAIVDVHVDGKLVFLKLGEELASDATPTLSITEEREVEDLAGNILASQEKAADAFKLKDGILPKFTLTLSGGSGTRAGSEGPSKLTETAMDISISSDEDINGAPRVAVVCSNIGWTTDAGTDKEKKRGLTDYTNNRSGYKVDDKNESDSTGDLPRCGDSTMPNSFNNVSSLSRPGNNWVYAWRNIDTDSARLNDGELAVVVWGRDRSEYDGHNTKICGTGKCQNWGLAETKFVLDDTFDTPLMPSGGSVQPAPGADRSPAKVKEPRPFILLDFAGEATTVEVTEFKVDGVDVPINASDGLESIGDNRFLYWPDALSYGIHTVKFDARDAADNDLDGQRKEFEFDVTARDAFVIDLSAGWNAISLPADPVDPAVQSVFTNGAVDMVAGWNPLSASGAWSIATQVDGVWGSNANEAPLTEILARYGYWVHSNEFIKQSVDLKGPINRETGGTPDPIGIITVPGWNFVGVVDQDGDQTENHFGKDLKDSEQAVINAKTYMPGFRQAYTWDSIANGYRVLGEDDAMKIGQGIWVFFPDDNAIAP